MKKNTTKKAPKKVSKVVKKHKAKENTSSQSFEPKDVSIIDKAKEIVAKSKSADMTETNEFCRMQQKIAGKIVEYDRIRTECKITYEGQRKTIYRLAKPFLNGHFTLAVVGKMSAGKSTFINTLIGDNLFPTGYFQTTSTTTYLERGSVAKMEALFCDGHIETILNDVTGIKTRLKELVAIDKKYRQLPIYDINLFISEGAGLDEILEAKNGIEVKRKKTIDEDLLREYVSNHPKESIAKSIEITYPLPKEYDGWRIIDTPGVAAQGGIQDATMELFADRDNDDHKNVDAILILHSGTDNIEDESVSNYMEEFANGMTEEAKRRAFFILTKASQESFRDHKDEIIENAISLYSQQFGIPKERFTYIDSLLERFLREIKDKVCATKKDCPVNWDPKDEWNPMVTVLGQIKEQLVDEGIQPVNESINDIMEQWSNFGQLNSMLNSFVKKEKSWAYEEICKKNRRGLLFFYRKNPGRY